MAKYRTIVQTLERRIGNGDYRVRPFPANRKLAAELGVSRPTVRKAVEELVQHGLLMESPTGRIAPARREKKMHLAMLAPAYPSLNVAGRFATLDRLAARRGWEIKLVGYHHIHDPVILEAIEGFDALFLIPIGDAFSPAAIAKLQARAVKAVALCADLTQDGIPSLRFENPGALHKVLDHLHERGHRSVACLNTQPKDGIMLERIRHWQLWKKIRNVSGPLIDHPVEHFTDPAPRARAVARQWLQEGRLAVDAVFCTTSFAAIGLMRALVDHGLWPGRDIAVCAGDGVLSQELIPSLTSPICPPDDPYFEMCLDWFASDEPQWSGPLLVQTLEGELFIGESTAPNPGVLRRPDAAAEKA